LKGKNRESGKIKGLFNAIIPSVVGNNGGGLNFLLTPHEFSDDPQYIAHVRSCRLKQPMAEKNRSFVEFHPTLHLNIEPTTSDHESIPSQA